MELKMKMYETTIEWKEEVDDLTSDELLDIFVRITMAFRYHPNSIKQSIIKLAKAYKDESMCDK